MLINTLKCNLSQALLSVRIAGLFLSIHTMHHVLIISHLCRIFAL